MQERYLISHFEGARLADELVIYKKKGTTTKTNAYGLEAVVVDGRIVSIGSNNREVPENGFVISGHGNGRQDILTFCVGAKAEIEGNILKINIDDDAKKFEAQKYLDFVKARNEEMTKTNDFDFEKAYTYIKEAEYLIENNAYDDAKKLCDEVYYLTTQKKENEIRAIWHRPLEKTREEVRATVKKLHDTGFNLLLVETNYEGYANTLKTKYDFLPPWKGYESFDVIEVFIEECHAVGMKIHAWLEDFFFGTVQTGCPMNEIHPELMAKTKYGNLLHDAYDEFYFLNPALDEVHDLLINMYKNLLDDYDFDGIQLDYIRYPIIKDIFHSAGFEEKTRENFKTDTGIDIDKIESTDSDEWKKFTEWRAECITKYVGRVRKLVDGYNKNGRNILLSTAVFGNPDEAVRIKCQNWLKWVKNGWLDMIFPMAYLSDAEDVGKEVKFMVDNYGEAPNVSGISPMYSHLPIIESTKQVEECRKAGAVGVAFFETKALTDEQAEKLKIGVFRK